MKRSVVISMLLILHIVNPGAQDMFPARRLTFDAAQQGFPAWSPDGKYIVYQYTDLYDTTGRNGLWKMLPDGSGKEQIFSGIAEHARWSPDDRFIVFDADTGNSIKMIPAGGGQALTFLPDSIVIHNGGLPCWSPDGSTIAFLERTHLSVCTYDINTGELKSIFREEGKLPLPGGWWNDGKSILAGPRDLQTKESKILRLSVDGKSVQEIKVPDGNFYRYLALSPDGSLLVYAAVQGRYLGLWVMFSGGSRPIPLTVTRRSHNEGPVWSPDGTKIAFTSTRSGYFDIWLMEVDSERIKEELGKKNQEPNEQNE